MIRAAVARQLHNVDIVISTRGPPRTRSLITLQYGLVCAAISRLRAEEEKQTIARVADSILCARQHLLLRAFIMLMFDHRIVFWL
jgi:hypothetical protein